jgi:hypothetical protein
MCNCNKTVDRQTQYVVTLPGGKTKIVEGEAAARIEVTVAGGGSYVAKSR